MIRVVVVDDQELVRAGLVTMLETKAGIEVVAQAGDGAEAVEQVKLKRPDLVLMDIRMPRMDGIEATRRIVGAGSTTRVLVLTTFDMDEYVFGALRAGASGFLLKDTPPAAIVDAVRRVAAGDPMLSPTVTRQLMAHLADAEGPTVEVEAIMILPRWAMAPDD